MEAGVAVTVAPLVALSPVAGDQLYVNAPAAVSDIELPEHIELDGVTVTVGNGLTVTVTLFEAEQPFVVPVTVYVVVAEGLSEIGFDVEPINAAGAVQLYVVAPAAVIATSAFEQTGFALGVNVIVGIEKTVI